MQKLISLLLIASLVCSCGTKRTPYSETVEMNEIVDKQKELYEQDIKALEERNANLLKELEKAYQKPEPEAKPEKKGMGWAKAFGVSVGIVASIAAIIGIATYIGGYVNRYQAINVTPEGAVRVTVYDYWKMWERFGIRPRLQRLAWQWDNTYVAVCNKLAVWLMQLTGVQTSRARECLRLAQQEDEPMPTGAARAVPITDDNLAQALAALHLAPQRFTGAAAETERIRNSVNHVQQDISLAYTTELENQRLRKNANAHMAEQNRILVDRVVALETDREKQRQRGNKYKAYIELHGGESDPASGAKRYVTGVDEEGRPTEERWVFNPQPNINPVFKANLQRMKVDAAYENGKQYGMYYGREEAKMEHSAALDQFFAAGKEQGIQLGIEQGLSMSLPEEQLKQHKFSVERGISLAKQTVAVKVSSASQYEMPPEAIQDAEVQTDPVGISSKNRDQVLYNQGHRIGWSRGFNMGVSRHNDYPDNYVTTQEVEFEYARRGNDQPHSNYEWAIRNLGVIEVSNEYP
ncbi:hypothetical protein [Candidatus Endomicrobiellum agilis]|uniref:hypothetical protein n=1 Tax=Candidatus Endomicrobiellum agilis TaxID=3238957 RepID=UPI0035850848|nr:hypothetical protein [Endomicrobium sp.]